MARRMSWPGRSEAGAATTEFVIIVPALMLLIMLVIQFALYYDAANVATAAAQDSVRAARIENGSAAAGQARRPGAARPGRRRGVHQRVGADHPRGPKRRTPTSTAPWCR